MRRTTSGVWAVVGVSLLLLAPVTAWAQEEGGSDLFSQIAWIHGPEQGRLGDLAILEVPEGFIFAEAEGAEQFMELTENPVAGNELGVLLSLPKSETDAAWFVVFSFNDIGYVKDDERDDLDADAILQSLREGTTEANKERQRRGWGVVEIGQWVEPPHYDTATNNLTWSLSVLSQGESSVNHSVRLLGRRGVMNADLVVGSDQLSTAIPAFEDVVAGFDFNSGHKYAEWRAGDKVASYGLTALVAGGAGVALAKSGLLAKFWKVLVAGAAAVVAAIKRLFGFGKKAEGVA